MPRKRAKHSAEYKHEALRRVVDGKEPVASVADDLGLARETLYRWMREYRLDPSEAFRGNGKLTSQDEEIRKLRQENARLKEERDILKKAAANSMGQRNTSFSLLAGVLYCKVFRGRWFSRSAIRFKYA